MKFRVYAALSDGAELPTYAKRIPDRALPVDCASEPNGAGFNVVVAFKPPLIRI